MELQSMATIEKTKTLTENVRSRFHRSFDASLIRSRLGSTLRLNAACQQLEGQEHLAAASARACLVEARCPHVFNLAFSRSRVVKSKCYSKRAHIALRTAMQCTKHQASTDARADAIKARFAALKPPNTHNTEPKSSLLFLNDDVLYLICLELDRVISLGSTCHRLRAVAAPLLYRKLALSDFRKPVWERPNLMPILDMIESSGGCARFTRQLSIEKHVLAGVSLKRQRR